MSSKEYPSSCLSLVMLGFEFVMLANHNKNLSLIGLEWSTLKSKTKNLKFEKKKNELQFVSFNWYSIDRKSHINKKLANIKSP